MGEWIELKQPFLYIIVYSKAHKTNSNHDYIGMWIANYMKNKKYKNKTEGK